jgi:AcrR family transcriptional regulator
MRAPQRRGAPVVDRVLALALEELAQGGFHRLSVAEIAERAGLNKTSIYRRWPTKEALVGAALARALGHDAPLPDTGALRSDMLAFALSAAAWADSPVGRGVMRTLMADGEDPEVRALVRGLLEARVAGPLAIFDRAKARGELPATADVGMALSVIAGTLSHRMFVENERATPEFVGRLVCLVADGLTGGVRGAVDPPMCSVPEHETTHPSTGSHHPAASPPTGVAGS